MPTSTTWWAIARFEIRYQLHQPVVHLVTWAVAVLLFVAGAGHGPGSATGQLHLNAPAVIAELLVKSSYLLLFLMTAVVASAALRDAERSVDSLFLSKPMSRVDYLTARFAGSMVVCLLACLVGASALALSSVMPWVDPSRLGPFRIESFLFAIGVLIIPTLLAAAAAAYAVAIWTRSVLAICLVVVSGVAAAVVASLLASDLDAGWSAWLLDPFGLVALSHTLRYWTVAELNTTVPGLDFALGWNRIAWLGAGLSAFVLAVSTFDRSRGARPSAIKPGAIREDKASAVDVRPGLPRVRRVFSARTAGMQFLHQLRLETGSVLFGRPFIGLLALGLFVLVQAAGSAGEVFGMPVHPHTHLMIEALRAGYSILLLLVVILYSGELVWKARSHGVADLQDVTPTPTGVLVAAKLGAMLLVVIVYLLIGALALAGFQLAHGYYAVQPALYLEGVALAAVYPSLMTVLAVFCHALARSRFIGYGLVIVFIVSWDVLEELGLEQHLYRYASLPPTPYSEFSGYQPFLMPFAWFSLYWGLLALALAGLTVLLWRRGSDVGLRARWTTMRTRNSAGVGRVVTVGIVGAVATGAWIVYNTHVLNRYESSIETADRRADYERRYRRYSDIPLPRIVEVRADVDLFPDRGRVRIRGSYRLRNRTTTPLRELHVSFPEPVGSRKLHLPAHDVILDDPVLGYGVLRLKTAIAPGAEISVGFEVEGGRNGFVNHGTQTTVLENGSYFTRRDYFPVIGYDSQRQLVDAGERQDHGLEPLRMARADEPGALRNTPRASDADRVRFETIVSTAPDQIAVTSGNLLREWTRAGRRYFHYRSDQPITHYFAYASARYAVARDNANGVAIEVYYHPRHGANVGRMLEAARRSLAYYTEHFGPYPHDHLRIVEFPGHVRDAQSLPGLIAYSESLGFNARIDGTEAIDFPFYVTAHEIAHQWWGQQLTGADVAGVAMLHETLAQYSALMVMEQAIGRERLRRVLAYERDWYLRGRATEGDVEQPLATVERQAHVFYHKGALAMLALRDAVGESVLNHALKRYLSRVAFQEAPYTASPALLDELLTMSRDDASDIATLVHDLFDRVTIHDIRLVSANSRTRPEGGHAITVRLAARKLQLDDSGVEQTANLDDWVDIAIYADAPDGGGVSAGTPFIERRRLRSSLAEFEILFDRLPTRVEIDPYFKFIERDRGDNALNVTSAG